MENSALAPPVKVVLLGQTCVGKSSLVLRFVQDRFFPNTEGTIGAAFLTKTLTLDETDNNSNSTTTSISTSSSSSSTSTSAANTNTSTATNTTAATSAGTSNNSSSTNENMSTVKFEIWDTAGQERYHSLAPMYYRGAQAAVVVFDITSRDSFDKSKQWVRELREKSTPDQIIALVGNKCDLSSTRAVDKEEADKYASEEKLISMETSAKDGTNVYLLFQTIAKQLPRSSIQTKSGSSAKLVTVTDSSDSKCKC